MTVPIYPDVVREGYEAAPSESNPYPPNSILWDMREAGRRQRELGQVLNETITHARARKLLKGGAAIIGTTRPSRAPRPS